jgi:hypothetical protein
MVSVNETPRYRLLYTFSAVLQTVELLLHQTQSLYNQRLEVNWWQAERQACIPRGFYFIAQETVNKMYESYRRIILKRDQKKKERKECVNTEGNKKLGVSSFTRFYLFSLKAATGRSTLIAWSRASQSALTLPFSRLLLGRVVVKGTRTNINTYVHINSTGVYVQI